MEKLKDIRAIAFDADDTLWALQNYFAFLSEVLKSFTTIVALSP